MITTITITNERHQANEQRAKERERVRENRFSKMGNDVDVKSVG